MDEDGSESALKQPGHKWGAIANCSHKYSGEKGYTPTHRGETPRIFAQMVHSSASVKFLAALRGANNLRENM